MQRVESDRAGLVGNLEKMTNQYQEYINAAEQLRIRIASQRGAIQYADMLLAEIKGEEEQAAPPTDEEQSAAAVPPRDGLPMPAAQRVNGKKQPTAA